MAALVALSGGRVSFTRIGEEVADPIGGEATR